MYTLGERERESASKGREKSIDAAAALLGIYNRGHGFYIFLFFFFVVLKRRVFATSSCRDIYDREETSHDKNVCNMLLGRGN